MLIIIIIIITTGKTFIFLRVIEMILYHIYLAYYVVVNCIIISNFSIMLSDRYCTLPVYDSISLPSIRDDDETFLSNVCIVLCTEEKLSFFSILNSSPLSCNCPIIICTYSLYNLSERSSWMNDVLSI